MTWTIDWSELSLQCMITLGHFLWQACAVMLLLMLVESIAEARASGPNGRYLAACVGPRLADS